MIEDGRHMGCSDSGPPESYSEYALSRGVDVIHAIKALVRQIVDQDCCPEKMVADIEKEMVQHCLPTRMLFEITWSKWQYRSKR